MVWKRTESLQGLSWRNRDSETKWKHARIPSGRSCWAEIPLGLVYYRHLSPALSGNSIKQNTLYCVQRHFLHSFGYDLRRIFMPQVWTSSHEAKKPWSWDQKAYSYREPWITGDRGHVVELWWIHESRVGRIEQEWCWFGIPSQPVGCTGISEQCAQSWAPHKMRGIDKLGQLQSTMTVTAMSERKLTLLENDWRSSHEFLNWNTLTWTKMYIL